MLLPEQAFDPPVVEDDCGAPPEVGKASQEAGDGPVAARPDDGRQQHGLHPALCGVGAEDGCLADARRPLLAEFRTEVDRGETPGGKGLCPGGVAPLPGVLGKGLGPFKLERILHAGVFLRDQFVGIRCISIPSVAMATTLSGLSVAES